MPAGDQLNHPTRPTRESRTHLPGPTCGRWAVTAQDTGGGCRALPDYARPRSTVAGVVILVVEPSLASCDRVQRPASEAALPSPERQARPFAPALFSLRLPTPTRRSTHFLHFSLFAMDNRAVLFIALVFVAASHASAQSPAAAPTKPVTPAPAAAPIKPATPAPAAAPAKPTPAPSAAPVATPAKAPVASTPTTAPTAPAPMTPPPTLSSPVVAPAASVPAAAPPKTTDVPAPAPSKSKKKKKPKTTKKKKHSTAPAPAPLAHSPPAPLVESPAGTGESPAPSVAADQTVRFPSLSPTYEALISHSNNMRYGKFTPQFEASVALYK
ncbi:hypothetical protein BHM03_00029764 [Ensete ventricosum]|nr:hypothetical protein BHM03_00029764 [Ensete ventricosum]